MKIEMKIKIYIYIYIDDKETHSAEANQDPMGLP